MKYKITDIKYKDDQDGPSEITLNDQELLKHENVTFINNSGELQKVNLNLILYLAIKEKFNKEIVACKIEDFQE
jgi:hypothetical protein